MNAVLRQMDLNGGVVLQIMRGDLLDEPSEAIVNAANAYLQHGAGVAGLIVSRGGKRIQDESDIWIEENGPLTHDKPAYTSAGTLPFRFIIHAVGPVWGEGNEDEKLSRAIRGSLKLASDLGLQSISIPPISTGIFGFPKDRAAGIFFKTINEFCALHSEMVIKNIRLVIIDAAGAEIFVREFDDWTLSVS